MEVKKEFSVFRNYSNKVHVIKIIKGYQVKAYERDVTEHFWLQPSINSSKGAYGVSLAFFNSLHDKS